MWQPASQMNSSPGEQCKRTPIWFEEADYQYFSTAHWHPIVNGDSREWPPQFIDLEERMKTFPEPAAASTLRDIGVTYVVLHTAQESARNMLGPAEVSRDFRLLARFDRDYLFQVTSVHAR